MGRWVGYMKQLLCAVATMLVPLVGHVSGQACYESSILTPSPFMGNNAEIFKLADGSLWEVKAEYEYLYEYHPSVIICPSRGKLLIGKKSLNVQLVSSGQRKAGIANNSSSSADTKADKPEAKTGKWELFEETALQGSISGTVEQGRIFKTTSGNVYEVTGLTLQLVLELQPDVTVLKNGDVYKLVVEGFEEPLICKLLSSAKPTLNLPKAPSTASAIETQISDTFEGWDGETIFKLSNGQIWQQAAYAYTYHYAYRPKVLIYLSGSVYRMKVEGVDSTIPVRRLK
jgi:hypothetical protein